MLQHTSKKAEKIVHDQLDINPLEDRNYHNAKKLALWIAALQHSTFGRSTNFNSDFV